MKELRTKLDVYVDYDETRYENEEDAKNKWFDIITRLLESQGLSCQVYEQEIQEV